MTMMLCRIVVSKMMLVTELLIMLIRASIWCLVFSVSLIRTCVHASLYDARSWPSSCHLRNSEWATLCRNYFLIPFSDKKQDGPSLESSANFFYILV